MRLGKVVGLGPGYIVFDRDLAPHSSPSTLSAHAYCGQMVAHLINCWALVQFSIWQPSAIWDFEKFDILTPDSWPFHRDILYPLPQWLSSRSQPWQDSYSTDITSQWRKDWNSASVVNSHLVANPTIRQPGFDLPQRQWSLLNRFCTVRSHCGACHKRWRQVDSDLCASGEPQMMSHIVDLCLLSKLHSTDDDVVRLTN